MRFPQYRDDRVLSSSTGTKRRDRPTCLATDLHTEGKHYGWSAFRNTDDLNLYLLHRIDSPGFSHLLGAAGEHKLAPPGAVLPGPWTRPSARPSSRALDRSRSLQLSRPPPDLTRSRARAGKRAGTPRSPRDGRRARNLATTDITSIQKAVTPDATNPGMAGSLRPVRTGDPRLAVRHLRRRQRQRSRAVERTDDRCT